jgi:hypothetical protein
MTFSASSADERVLDVRFTGDAISVDPARRTRVITAPLVWYPRLLNVDLATQELEKFRRWLWNSLARTHEDLSTEGLLRRARARASRAKTLAGWEHTQARTASASTAKSVGCVERDVVECNGVGRRSLRRLGHLHHRAVSVTNKHQSPRPSRAWTGHPRAWSFSIDLCLHPV